MTSNNISNNQKLLNPVQLKKSFISGANTHRILKTIEKKEKGKNIIISMSKDHKEVLLFLQELNMGDYFDNFINNGINTKEKLLYLTNDNLKVLNIQYAHRFRILKKLKESKNLENMKKFLEKGKLSKIKLKKETSKYEEIIMPKEDDDKEVSHEEMRRTFTEAIYDFQKTHTKFTFENNENDDENGNENVINENIEHNLSNNTSNINCYETNPEGNSCSKIGK